MTFETDSQPDKPDDFESHSLSRREFLHFGMDEVAYVKAMSAEDGHPMFGIYAADGTELTVLEQWDKAIAVIRDHDLTPLSVH